MVRSRLAVIGCTLLLAGSMLLRPSAQAATSRSHGVPWGAVRHSVGRTLTPRLATLSRRPASHRSVPAFLGGLPPSGPGSIVRPAPDSVLVEIRMKDTGRSAVGRLTESGAGVRNVDAPTRTVTAEVRTTHLAAVAKTEGVLNVREVLAPLVGAQMQTTPSSPPPGPSCAPVVSEGDTQLKADLARANFSVDGRGTKIGILSDSFDRAVNAATNAADDVASGELPGTTNPCGYTTPVDVLDDAAPTTDLSDEGRAMAQIVHGLAPGAELSFATACCTEAAMAKNVELLAAHGANVIVDDLTLLYEPMFQDGPVAAAISKVRAKGVTYITAAGNDNVRVGGKDVGSYETPRYRGIVCPLTSPYVDCHNFATSGSQSYRYGLTIAPGRFAIYELQWAQPRYGVSTDLDLFAINNDNKLLTYSVASNAGKNGTQLPFEIIGVKNTAGRPMHISLAIGRTTGPDVRFKLIALQDAIGGVASVDHAVSSGGDIVGPSIFGHSGSADAVTVGAVRFDKPTATEGFSSRGPFTEYFAPVNGTKAAARLKAPLRVNKPDVDASDCVRTSFFHDLVGSAYRFCGTSAAAPHAAAVIALGREHVPAVTPYDIGVALSSSAVDLLPAGRDVASGAGLIDADAALGILKVLPKPPPTSLPTVPSEDSHKPAVTLSADQLKVGSVLELKGANFAPHTLFDVYLHSKPLFLGSTPTSSNGTFAIDVFVPESATPGAHAVQIRRADGDGLEVSMPVTVLQQTRRAAAVTSTTPVRLPRTGADVVHMVVYALFFMALGTVLAVWSRREALRLAFARVAVRSDLPARVSVYALLAHGERVLPRVEHSSETRRDDTSPIG